VLVARRQSTDKWLQKLLVEPRDVILVGGVVLGETVVCPHAK